MYMHDGIYKYMRVWNDCDRVINKRGSAVGTECLHAFSMCICAMCALLNACVLLRLRKGSARGGYGGARRNAFMRECGEVLDFA